MDKYSKRKLHLTYAFVIHPLLRVCAREFLNLELNHTLNRTTLSKRLRSFNFYYRPYTSPLGMHFRGSSVGSSSHLFVLPFFLSPVRVHVSPHARACSFRLSRFCACVFRSTRCTRRDATRHSFFARSCSSF